LNISCRFSFRFVVRLAALSVLSVGALATTVTIPAGTGTLTFTETFVTTQHHCVSGGTAPTTVYTDSGFSYKDASGSVTTLSGTNRYIADGCNQVYTGGPVTLTSTLLNVVFDTTDGPTGAVTGFQPHGYLNPKYVILGVTYAPPGPSSSVNYLNSTTLSSTTDAKSSFSSTYQQTLKTNLGINIEGWKAGVSSTTTTKYAQASYTSTSVTLSKTTSLSEQTPGPADPYVGLNHDYDIIWVWLNPVQLFTLVEDTSYKITTVEWDGFGFSTLDQPDMDIYPVYVGWLNGDIAMTQSQLAPLQRAWAAGEIWPSGQGPALTSADYQAIGQADPYWQCTPKPSACPTTVDGTHYTQTLNQDLVYLQAPVGGQPITENYTDSYTKISTQGQGGSFTYSETFAWESTLGYSKFGLDIGSTLSGSTSLDWVDEWDRSLTSTNTQTATVSITGPPCVVSGATCNPVYTKSTEFDLYEDNLYGTFMFFPLN
jgi:hypothetical protein